MAKGGQQQRTSGGPAAIWGGAYPHAMTGGADPAVMGGGGMGVAGPGGLANTMAPAIGGLSPSQIQSNASAPMLGGQTPAQIQSNAAAPAPAMGPMPPQGGAGGNMAPQQSPLAGLLGQFASNPQFKNSPLMGLLSHYFGH